jgi:tRNA-dihydrouridine synthase
LKQAFRDTRQIMAGRGLLRNPLLAANIKGIAVERPEETVKSFIQELAKALSRDRSGGRRFPQGIKEHWWHLSHSFPESGTVFDTIKVINDLQTYHAAVEHIFENHEFLVG